MINMYFCIPTIFNFVIGAVRLILFILCPVNACKSPIIRYMENKHWIWNLKIPRQMQSIFGLFISFIIQLGADFQTQVNIARSFHQSVSMGCLFCHCLMWERVVSFSILELTAAYHWYLTRYKTWCDGQVKSYDNLTSVRLQREIIRYQPYLKSDIFIKDFSGYLYTDDNYII